MSTLNRRDLLQWSVACGVGAAIHESGLSRRAVASDSQPTAVPPGEPPIKTRMFWTWDHSTEWALNRAGANHWIV